MTVEPELKTLYTRQQVAEAVKKLADEIHRDYAGKNPVIIGILKGSFMFIADLVRELGMPIEVEFVGISSYGSGTESSGHIQVTKGITTDIKGRHVIVAEDILDTGYTMNFLLDHIRQKRPASFRLCVLLDKPERRKVPIKVDYRGFTVPNKFIVGYGIDWDEKYRYLPDICWVDC